MRKHIHIGLTESCCTATAVRARNKIVDNLDTHGLACLAKKIEWHDTPEHGSWLNMAEIELSVLSRQCLSRRIADIALQRGY